MPRTALTPQQLTGAYVTVVQTLTFAASDPGNGNTFQMAKGDILIVLNSDASGHHFTLTSVADREARTGDITSQAIAAGAYAAYGPMDFAGWMQTDGSFHLTTDDATVKFAILRQP